MINNFPNDSKKLNQQGVLPEIKTFNNIFDKIFLQDLNKLNSVCSSIQTSFDSTNTKIGKFVDYLNKFKLEDIKDFGEFKTSFDNKTNHIIESIDGLKDVLLKTIGDLNNSVNILSNTITESNIQQRIEWAIDHSDIGSFEYFIVNEEKRINSSYLVKCALINFRNNLPFCVDKYQLKYLDEIDVDSNKMFCESFLDQIHQLTCIKPRMQTKQMFIK